MEQIKDRAYRLAELQSKPGDKGWVHTGEAGGSFGDKSLFKKPVDKALFYKHLIKG